MAVAEIHVKFAQNTVQARSQQQHNVDTRAYSEKLTIF
jgi:hypothetical protein